MVDWRRFKKLVQVDPWAGFVPQPFPVVRQGHGPGTIFSALELAGMRPIHLKMQEPICLTDGDRLVGHSNLVVGNPSSNSIINIEGNGVLIQGLRLQGAGTPQSVCVRIAMPNG